MPLNQRIEDQNYEKVGREGKKGSFILIIQYNEEFRSLSVNNLKLKKIKQKREKAQNDGVQKLIKNEKVFFEQKEELFKKIL